MNAPAHLETSISLLDDYLVRLPDAPLLALGEYGCGRGYAIETVLREHGLEPVWLYEPTEAPTDDLAGNSLFAVYDLRRPSRPPSVPSILLVDPDSDIPEDLKDGEKVAFAPPFDWEIAEFLKARGVPESLAVGNPTYASALNAALAYEVAGVEIRRDPLITSTWESFRAGGPPPVDDGLLAWYLGWNLGPENWWAGRNLWLKRRVPARFADLLYEQIREVMPERPVFPAILKVSKAEKDRKKRDGSTPAPANVAPIKEKGYSIEW